MLKLPSFRPTEFERAWVRADVQTARIVRTLWQAASASQRSDAAFLAVLTRSTWVNGPEGSGDASRRLRNSHLADWLGLDQTVTDSELATALHGELSLTKVQARWIVRSESGITHYYKAQRPGFAIRIKRHANAIRAACEAVSKRVLDPAVKVLDVVGRVLDIPSFRTPAGGRTSMLNGLTPLLACLDPQRRFPIMNSRTARLLAALGERNDRDGAVALSELIGQFGIRHSFDLDVYAASSRYEFPPARAKKRFETREPGTIGLKAEEDGVAILRKKRIQIRHQHNVLINRFTKAVRWSNPPVESEFDALIAQWRPGRQLLIEAKPTLSGVAGRSNLRMAIGQLYDYRWRNFPPDAKRVDLALLTPRKPEPDVLDLLATLKIESLWFEGRKLTGTISLSS